MAENNMLRNGFSGREDIYATADVFDILRAYYETKWRFEGGLTKDGEPLVVVAVFRHGCLIVTVF